MPLAKKRTVELAPIIEDTKLAEAIEAEIARVFKEEIYLPILKILKLNPKDVITNAKDSKTPNLEKAIRSGRITFYRGQFTGKFNAKVVKELRSIGATKDLKTKGYKLLSARLPSSLKTVIDATAIRATKTLDTVLKRLASLTSAKIAGALDIKDIVDKGLFDLDKKVTDNLKSITVSPELSSTERALFVKDYSENMDKHIKTWADKELLTLRKKVESNYKAGIRRESLEKDIQKRYGVSKTKAKFLARQETSLASSKFKEVRYKSAGSLEYKWKTVAGSANHPVRPDHKELNNKMFKWDSPPITDKKSGRRNHPGEDYNCRCVARPVITL